MARAVENHSICEPSAKALVDRQAASLVDGASRNYSFIGSPGATVTGAQVNYNGQPTGYTKSPIEAVNYASVHDNQDIFDAIKGSATVPALTTAVFVTE